MKKNILLLICVLSAAKLFSQVNVQTGAAVYDIPIFSHTDPKCGLSTGVSLVYGSGNGVKVNEYASAAGQGWELNAGGFIQRIQYGEPDDQYQAQSFTLDPTVQIYERDNPAAFTDYYPNGYLFATSSLDDIPRENALLPRFKNDNQGYKYLTSPRGMEDKEQDVFLLAIGGSVKKFAIGKNGVPEMLDDSKVSVAFQYYTNTEMTNLKLRTRIKSFTVTDDNGTVYNFSTPEFTELTNLHLLYTDGQSSFSLNVYESERIDKYVVNKWMLTSIVNPYTNESIQFNYADVDLNALAVILPQYQEFNPYNPLASFLQSLSINRIRSFVKVKRLSEIIFPDNFSIQFNYDYRQDIEDHPHFRLWRIQVKYGTKVIKEVQLRHGYFYKGELKNTLTPSYQNTNDQRFLRLCMTDLLIGAYNLGNSKSFQYHFEYYTGTPGSATDIVAPVNSMAQDAWGYYNASSLIDDNVSDITLYSKPNITAFLTGPYSNHYPNDGLAQNGLLRSIRFPTGGTLSFEYEQNDCIKPNGQYAKVGGVRVKRTVSHDGVTSNVTINPDLVTDYRYVTSNGNTSGWGYDDFNNYLHCSLKYHRDNSGFAVNGVLRKPLGITIGIIILEKVAVYVLDAIVPGLGTAIMSLINVVIIAVDPIADYDMDTWNLYPNSSVNPKPFQYSRVEILNGSIANGKTVYEFSKPANEQTEFLPIQFPFSQKPRANEWRYGLPLKTTVYDNTGNPVKETETVYNYAETNLGTNFRSVKFDVNTYLSSRYDWPAYNSSNIGDPYFSSDPFTLTRAHAYAVNTKERFIKNGRINETVTEFTYTGSTNNQPREIYSFNSEADKVGKTIYYSGDYTITTGAMAVLAANNVKSLPIMILSWFIPAGSSTKQFTGISITEYGIASNGEVKPFILHSANNKAPVPQSLVGSFNPNSIFITYPNLQPFTINTYDNSGSLVQSACVQCNKNTSYLYDYDNRLPVATVNNAVSSDVAYSSFETDVNPSGGWTIANPEYSISNYNSVTGNRVLKFKNDGSTVISKNNLNPSQKYILTYWAKSGNTVYTIPYVGSTWLTTVNGWYLYKYEFTGLSSISLNSSDQYIDELRLYPANAQMSTTAYDPAFGKTSECDINDHTLHYRYDALGRLIMVQDETRNAVKTYEYNSIYFQRN